MTTFTQERTLMQIGGFSGMFSAIVTIMAIMLSPLGTDSHNMAAVLEYFSTNASRLQVHGLGIAVGKLLLLGGFVALYASLRTNGWASLGMAAAVVTTVINIIGPMMGGAVMPAEEAAAALQAAQGFYYFYEALLGPTLLSMAVALLPFAIAVQQTERYLDWLGWLGIIVGLWLVIGGVAFTRKGSISKTWTKFCRDGDSFINPGGMGGS
jgi:hypothetical protein